MKHHEREFFIARILSGHVSLGEYQLSGYTDWSIRLKAEELYREVLEEGLLSGLYSMEDIQALLTKPFGVSNYRFGITLWAPDDDVKLSVLKEDTEKLKVGIYESQLNLGQKEAARVGLRKAEAEISRLLTIKHSLDGMTAQGLATMHKQIFLIGSSIVNGQGARLLGGDWYKNTYTPLLSVALKRFSESVLDEAEYRELARNDPWRSIWSARKSDGLFGRNASELSEEQRTLVLWSQFYDNVYENPECPPDSVIDDNDALDGWTIVQRRKREKENLVSSIEDKLSDKAKKANEIFIPAEDDKAAAKIDSINSIEARIIKRQRLNQVRQQGHVNEIDFKDVQQSLKEKMQAMKEEKERG